MALEPRTQAKAQDRRAERKQVARAAARGAFALVCAFACVGCKSERAKTEAEFRQVQAEANPQTLLERGKAFAFVGDYVRAEEYLAQALEAGADAREVLPMLMDVCVRGGRYRSAIQHGENHLRKHPTDARTRLMVGALYAAIDEPDKATEHLELVVEKPLPPPSVLHGEAHYLLGVVARDKHELALADQHFREYLRIEPNGKHVEEARGSLLSRVPQAPTEAPIEAPIEKGAKP